MNFRFPGFSLNEERDKEKAYDDAVVDDERIKLAGIFHVEQEVAQQKSTHDVHEIGDDLVGDSIVFLTKKKTN